MIGRVRNALPVSDPRHVARCTYAYVQDRVARHRYTSLTPEDAAAARTSDTVFVLGAGKSLLDMTDAEWARIDGMDSLSFSEFFRQPWIAPKFHMIGEVANVEDFGRALSSAELLRNTILVVQEGWRAEDGNRLLGRKLVEPGTRILRYRRRSRGRYSPPSTDFREGVVHGWNSSISSTNIAYLLGWKRIVLTGIDLYDKEYFWLPEGGRRPTERANVVASSTFPNASLIVETLGRWRALLEPEGVSLEVYNPRSLLADVMPVHDRSS